MLLRITYVQRISIRYTIINSQNIYIMDSAESRAVFQVERHSCKKLRGSDHKAITIILFTLASCSIDSFNTKNIMSRL